MNLSISGHHLEVTPAIRDYVSQKLGRINRHFDRVIDVKVLLSVDKLVQKAEINIHVPGKEIFAESTDADLYAALDSLAVPLPSPAPLPLASYAVTLQRPLFTESRRPLPAAGVNAAAQAPAAPDELEKSQLLGLISGPSFVGIMARIDGQVRTVRRGDNIGPWTLRAIRDREVVFTQGDHERVLKLEYARGGADQAAAAAAERAAPPAPVAPAPTSARAPIAAPPPAPATAAVQPPAARPTSPAPAASPGAGPAWSLGARSAPRQPTASAPAR